ncbi:hypothetical protein QBC40DRAFT_234098 [Triangularia verruculosa]|uniref:Uncharacterized protein n=1 Tax=Triangularia verruculosa TaxID=2587418 RepID=A0AAN6XAC3_9PEZI|nr:hypothetical protein QBC40DRAFT_234098 [Triangularia verruculosa]
MARGLLFSVTPIILNITTLILLCLVIFSGFNNSLTQIYWMKTDNTKLSIPPALAGSKPLEDLSIFTGTDYIGPNSTATTLSLPDHNTIHLLTECGLFPDDDNSKTECSNPDLNFWFRPERDLKLSATSRGGRESAVLRDALGSYSRSSRFIEWSFIIGALCALFAPLESYFSPLFAGITCAFATVMLGAGTITAAVVFRRLADAINDEFRDEGISAVTGGIPIAFGVVGAGMFAAATVCYVMSHRKGVSAGGWKRGGKGGFRARSVGGEQYGAAPGGLFGGQHKYVPIEKQSGGQQQGVVGDRDLERRLDDDWAAPDEYSGRNNNNNGGSIPMVSMGAGGNKQTKDLNTAYEPYSRQL